ALAFALATTSLAYGLAAIFGAPLAGAWVDRHDRKRIMLFVESRMAVSACS
ncbi:MAG: MFS transporter, partial [Chloroflexia bacterium]|nr:MFS transporter [Chloroflexia bacterium]